MPKVNLGKPNQEVIFGDKLKASITENHMECRDMQKILGCSSGTLSSRFKNPGKMPLGELKRFIKATGLKQEAVIKYLYE